MGLVGIKLKISVREEIPRDFDLNTESPLKSEPEVENQSENKSPSEDQKAASVSEVKTESKDIINSEVKEIAANKSET
jgi:small subunit ribosomal protein S3